MAWFLLGCAVIAASLGASYWRWARRTTAEIAEGADIEWSKLREVDPELIEGLDRKRFGAIYHRVHFPRFPGYALATVCAFIVSLPVSFGALAAGVATADVLGLTPGSVELADRFLVEDGKMRIVTAAPPEAAAYYVSDLAGFYYFFGVLASWLLIVWFFMRRYHARRPGYLREEILRARSR